MLAQKLKAIGDKLGTDVTTLVAALGELGTAQVRLGWWDASDRVSVTTAWPGEAPAKRIAASDQRQHKVTVPALRARRPAGWVQYETVPRRAGVIATAVGFPGACDPAEELAALVAVSRIKPEAAARMRELWPLTGVRCDLVVDRTQPPLGANLWQFSGPVDAYGLASALDRLAPALHLLDAHRALAERAGAGSRALRIGLDGVFDGVHPVVHVAATVDWAAARELIGAATGDAAKAGVVADAYAAHCVHPEVTLRLAHEAPMRVRLVAELAP